MNVLDHILHLCIDLDPCFLVVDNKWDQDSRKEILQMNLYPYSLAPTPSFSLPQYSV
jgi:hypothetical protein